MEIKYNSYEEMPISVYLKLRDIITSDDDDSDKEVLILALLCGVPKDEFLELNLSEIQGLNVKCSFLQEKHINLKKDLKTVKVNNVEYTVCTDLNKFTVALYVDFLNYPKDEKHLAENLSTFVIPKGKKYGEDYDIDLVIKDFNEYMDISTAISLQNFLTKKSLISINNTLHYLFPLMKREMKKTKNPEATEIIKKITQIQRTYGFH